MATHEAPGRGSLQPGLARLMHRRSDERMRGFITTKDVLLHPVLIIRVFGVRAYGRCLARMSLHPGHSTFLECI